jgi:hypothetical protein
LCDLYPRVMRQILAVGLLLSLSSCSCSRPVAEPPPAPAPEVRIGAEGGACTPLGNCDAGLFCDFDDVCKLDDPFGEGEGEPGGEGEGEDPNCVDLDNDNTCAARDCDDSDPRRSPDNPERCNDIDDDCDGTRNDGIDCTFLAHSRDAFYRVDPFNETVTFAGNINVGTGGVLDIDRDVDGVILATTSEGIYEVSDNGDLSLLANVTVPPRTVGMAITGEGVIYVVNQDGADSAAWRVGRDGTIASVGLLNPYLSSGDCVVTKSEDLLMSARGASNGDPDLLVAVNQVTAQTTVIGSIGFGRVYGLSDSFGHLYGVTANQEIIDIDRGTGAGVLLFTADVELWGAANGD